MGDAGVTLLKDGSASLGKHDAAFFPGMPKTWGLSQINTEKGADGASAV